MDKEGERYFQEFLKCGNVSGVVETLGISRHKISKKLNSYLPYCQAKKERQVYRKRATQADLKTQEYFEKFLELGSIVAVANYYEISRHFLSKKLNSYLPYRQLKNQRSLPAEQKERKQRAMQTSPKAQKYFEKFLELNGNLSAVARHYKVSRQNVEQYLRNYLPYQQYKQQF